MRQAAIKGLVLASLASLGLAACSSSSSTSSGGASTSSASPLVIESAPISPMTATFNPFVQSSTGYSTQSTWLYYETLYIFNITNPTQAPIPMLASGQPTWSNGGKTVTIPIRSGVKWSDGKPFTAADVAFTFNLLKQNPSLFSGGAPVVTSATASGSSVTLNYSAAEYSNLFLIGGVYIVPQHIWQSISNPAGYADANPVGTGPYVLDKFSNQGFLLKANPGYWDAQSVKVPEVDFPSYSSNANLVAPIASGQIDWAGNYVPSIQQNYLSKASTNTTWLTSAPYFADNNVVTLWLNVTKAPLSDVAVRQAISYGVNRQQLSVQGESSYEPVATSSSGLMLPTDSAFLDPSLAGDLPATPDAAKVSSILKADGWNMVNGKWTKGGQRITFTISDPSGYTDYFAGDHMIANSLNSLGFNVSVNGIADPAVWNANFANGNFDATIHWSAQGPNPYFYYANWLDHTATAPIGKPASADNGRFNSAAAQQALAAFAATNDPAAQKQAIVTLGKIMSTQVPMVPLLYGGAWSEISTRHYTGWPSASNPYMTPVPNSPYLE